MKILTKINTTFTITIALLLCTTNIIAAEKSQATHDVIAPDIERSETEVPRIKTEDYEIGAFIGIYSTEDFGTEGVFGVTGSYHLTEDIFYSFTLGSSNVSDAHDTPTVTSTDLTYFNLLFGYNILPGEVYSSAGKAWSSSTYFVGGLGVTEINDSQNLTIVIGGGLRLVPIKSMAIHIDFRDHILNSNLIGKNKTIQNIEITAGASWFF